jgi:hypothetical protein
MPASRGASTIARGAPRNRAQALPDFIRVAGHARRSSSCFSLCAFRGISLRACRRTRSGISSLPIPCPWKASEIVTRERSPFSSGSIVPLTTGLIGPSTPHAPALVGIELRQLDGHRHFTTADPSHDNGSRSHCHWTFVVLPPCREDVLLPLREMRDVGQVREDVFRAAGDLDVALHDCGHLFSFCWIRRRFSASGCGGEARRRLGKA